MFKTIRETWPLHRYPHDTQLNDYEFRITAYCAEEVRRQGDSPWHVYRMYEAWMFAIEQYERGRQMTPALIRQIGKYIDELNDEGFRTGNIWIGERKIPPFDIDRRIDRLCANFNEWEPIDVYADFEDIHPFNDGNGRTGKVLYNWRNDSLRDPVWPKDLFGGIKNP